MSSSLTFTLSALALLTVLFAISSFLACNVPKLLTLSAAATGLLSALVRLLKWAFNYSLRSSVLGHSYGHGEPGAFRIAHGLSTARYRVGTPVECAVCLCEVGAREEVRELKCCNHVLHRACLDRWLSYKNVTCPLCRRFVVRRTSMRMVTEFGAEIISFAFYDVSSSSDREAWWLR